MEEQEKRTEEEQADVEAHKKKFQPMASEDAPSDEGESEDFELHRKGHRAL